MFKLNNKIAVITGATGGLGSGAAMAYAQYGADVALLDLGQEKLDALAAEIQSSTGRKALTVQCDLCAEDQVQAAVEKIIAAYGRIDILLNNVGKSIRKSIEDISREEWDSIMETNVYPGFFMCKYALPHMKAQQYGKIVNISSANAILGSKDPTQARHVYNAAKAAVHGMTVGLAGSYAQFGITVNSIAPALFKTPMTANTSFADEKFLEGYCRAIPINRTANDGELNGTIIYLSSDASSYVTGQYLLVDGGLHCV